MIKFFILLLHARPLTGSRIQWRNQDFLKRGLIYLCDYDYFIVYMLVLNPPPYIPHLLTFVISVIACICIVSISIDMVRCYF